MRLFDGFASVFPEEKISPITVTSSDAIDVSFELKVKVFSCKVQHFSILSQSLLPSFFRCSLFQER